MKAHLQTLSPPAEPAKPLAILRNKRIRPAAAGKFLSLAGEKFWIRGVTYGTFRPSVDDCEYKNPEIAGRDLRQMSSCGLNAVRTYTVPPSWFLDLAWENDIRVMVGIPWEEHIDFLADRERRRSIEKRVRGAVRSCSGHPAILCYAIGNEIPSPVVRWLGPRRVERFLGRLCNAAREQDPGGLFTYVNYPSTEYLELPELDLFAFNVYLESRDKLEPYLSRLQNLSGDRPLIMAEIGLDSLRNGEEEQAVALTGQIQTAFAAGAAGAFVFSWTDEWHRGGFDIEDWDFGLVRRDRSPKPALAAASAAFAEAPFSLTQDWPLISVVVCSYNGSRTMRECMEGLAKVEYPAFEVIVVDDGSTDRVGKIAAEYGVAVIRTENRGLSAARNTGAQAARGEIIAYIDDDVIPDPHWLFFLAHAFRTTSHAAVGGPNLAPLNSTMVAQCVSRALGNPVHVLLSDDEAEHLPGCNLAVRKSAFEAIGGFDDKFRIAGDDVDFCWRLQKQGWTLGFAPGAMVWHHRRDTLKAYWKQQRNYGRAEAMLERKWPQKYNDFGHLRWLGRLYGSQAQLGLRRRKRIYHGTWGSAPFQSIYEPSPSLLQILPSIPEWFLVNVALAVLSGLGFIWSPLFSLLPLLAVTALTPLAQVVVTAAGVPFRFAPGSSRRRPLRRLLLALLFVVQPLARLSGRLGNGLTPWRRPQLAGPSGPRTRRLSLWSERWSSPEDRLCQLESSIRSEGAAVRCGGVFDTWDLEIRGGVLANARLRSMAEEHGAGRQLVRLRTWPHCSPFGLVLLAVVVLLAILAFASHAWLASLLIGGIAALWGGRIWLEFDTARACILRGARRLGFKPD